MRSALKTEYFPLRGGLDLATPALSVAPGTLLDCMNFAPDLNGGYRLVGQYEAFDGQPAPSAATYYILEVADTSSFTVDDNLLGGTSGTTAVVVAIDATNNYLIITKLAISNFSVGETVGATTVVTSEDITGADTVTLDTTYRLAAEDDYRDDIAAVPGSGDIRGIWRHKAKTYAFRDNAGATAVDIYKASASGWTAVTIASHYVWFDAGTTAFTEGDTVTGATSGASGTVHRVILHSGAWDGTGVGYLVLTGVTGDPFTNNENLQVSAVTFAVADGNSSIVSFAVGGRFEFRSHNFLGTSTSYYVYGCDGINAAFEIDNNDVVSPIFMPTFAGAPSNDTPHLIEVHKGHLFLAFPDGIIEHSTPTDAMTFNAFLGSAEFGLSEDITGMHSVAGGVLIMWTRRQTWGLYGLDVSDWEKRAISDNTGCVLWGAVPIERIYAWDDRGVTRMDRVQAFGDFQNATVSKKVQKTLAANIQNLVGSVVFKERNQFWYMLDSGDFVIAHVTEKGNVEFGWGLLPFIPYCVYNAPDETGAERIFIGGADGFVYEMNKGSGHNGVAMQWGFRTTYNHFRSPRLRKAFKHLTVELETDEEVAFDIATEFDYSASHLSNNDEIGVTSSGGGGFWESAIWNNFYWSAQDVPTADISLTGTGTNLSIIVYATTNLVQPFTLQGFMVHYIPRRIDRG